MPKEYPSAVKMADKGSAICPIHAGSLNRELVNHLAKIKIKPAIYPVHTGSLKWKLIPELKPK